MLDTFIIDRIRREREREREAGYQPLRIERLPPPQAPEHAKEHEQPETPPQRGSVTIDFRL